MSQPLNYDPTDPDKMRLPAGIACGDCGHIRRCKAIYGHTETDTYCDWSPSRFFQAPAAAPAAVVVATPTPVRDDRRVLHLMVQQGGAFVHHLARAWLCADPINSDKLMSEFSDCYDGYARQLSSLGQDHGFGDSVSHCVTGGGVEIQTEMRHPATVSNDVDSTLPGLIGKACVALPRIGKEGGTSAVNHFDHSRIFEGACDRRKTCGGVA